MAQWDGQKSSEAAGRSFELRQGYFFTFYIAHWMGQKGSEATGRGFEPRYKLYIFFTFHTFDPFFFLIPPL